MGSSPTRGGSFFLGKVTTLGVLCCFALFVCLTLLAAFFLPSHLSFKNMYNVWYTYMYMYIHCSLCTATCIYHLYSYKHVYKCIYMYMYICILVHFRFPCKTSASTESLVGEALEKCMAVAKMTLGKCQFPAHVHICTGCNTLFSYICFLFPTFLSLCVHTVHVCTCTYMCM